MGIWALIRRTLNQVFGDSSGEIQPDKPTTPGMQPQSETIESSGSGVSNSPPLEPIKRKVMTIIYDPPVPFQDNKPLSQVMGWNDFTQLVPAYISDIREASYGLANFEVVKNFVVDHFPIKKDGFVYSVEDFIRCMQTGKGFHEPDSVDYLRIIKEFDIINRINYNEVDEIWLFGFPYAGFYESIMGGPEAFWCNAPVLEGTEAADRRFIIMGFNYQRGVGEMLEALGHRAESIINHAFRYVSPSGNLWERFTRVEKTHPGKAEVGTVHYAPNSQTDYDWGNKTKVWSRCHIWNNFPNLAGEPSLVDCSEWGNGNIRAHHIWWMKHFPHIAGQSSGVAHNWWKYIADPNNVR